MQGFLKAYDSVRAKVMAIADTVLGDEPHTWHAYVTGHSLGGALATLCSYELALRRCRQLPHAWQCLQNVHESHSPDSLIEIPAQQAGNSFCCWFATRFAQRSDDCLPAYALLSHPNNQLSAIRQE